ncbi:MAG: LacI family DNA-binding transcriptional regulator [Verrucomicrobia bacterium]|nr:LacI family DNA-binding transcriptional regulator [Verrucomicrobiota bacterium]
MSARVSLREIAAGLGVSHTTVSLALRDDPRLPASTRRKIRRYAAERGYRVDAVVSSLMARLRTLREKPVQATLGFVTAWPTRHGWRAMPNLERFHRGVERRSRELGYALDELWLHEPGMSSERMTRILRARGIRGLILQSLPAAGGRLQLGWRHFACVAKGLTVNHPPVHRVVSSHYEDMQRVLQELARRRYRRIGLVLSEALSVRVDRAWLAAFLLHQNDRPEPQRVPALITRAADEEAHFREWQAAHRPEVILFSDQPIPAWVDRLGLRVPDEVGLVHLDWSKDMAPLAGLDSDPEAVGAAATDLLVGQLQANEYGIPRHEKIVAVRGHWVPGSSVRPR